MKHIQPYCSKYIMRAKKFYATNKFLIKYLNIYFLYIKIYFYLCVYFTMFGIISYNMSPYFIKYKLPSIKIGYIIICSTKKGKNTVIIVRCH